MKLFTFTFIFLCAFSAFAQKPLSIKIPFENTISGEQVLLSAIAQISGEPAKIERLRNVSLGLSPNIGATREILREKIILAITTAGFNENEYQFEAPPKVFVKRSAQKLSRDLLRETIENKILADFQQNGAEVKIVRLDLPSEISVPEGKIEIKANYSGVRNFFLPFSVLLEVKVDNKTFGRLVATAQITVSAEILVTKRNLTANVLLRETDVNKKVRQLKQPLSAYLREVKDLRGAVLKQPLNEGSEITFNSLISGIVVNIGDTVRVVGQSGKLTISLLAEARHAGRIGDRIQIKNRQSGTTFQATVLDEGLVQVRF